MPKPNTKSLKVTIQAHHRNEEFRQYSIHFKDRNDSKVNLIQALKLSIKREGGWNGWFDAFGELSGKMKEVNAAIEKLINEGLEEIVVFGVDYTNEGRPTATKKVGLVIWNFRHGNNIGFGIGNNTTKVLGNCDTNKDENRWITLG